MLMILNNAAPFIGLIICLLVWRLERFNTKPFAIQITYVFWILVTIFWYAADNNPTFNPTFGSVTARYLVISSIFTVASYVYIVTCKIRQLNAKINQLTAKQGGFFME